MDFEGARKAVTRQLEKFYADERESPKVLAYGFDTGAAWAPMVDWRGVMGVYIHLVDKRSGDLTPLSFPEFADMPDPEPVGPWPSDASNSRLQVVTTRMRARLREGVPVAHPGHPDQKSHGRKSKGAAGKNGVRDALAGAESIDEINAAASAEARRITGHGIEFALAGQDPQIAREHAEGILRGLERYPDADLAYVGSYGPGGSRGPMARQLEASSADAYAVTAGAAIYFNTHSAASADGYRAALRRGELAGDIVSGSPRGVALHEFGHIAARRVGVVEGAMAAARTMAASKGQDTQHYIAERVSNYATESADELVGEAFADVMSFGSDASPLSRAIVDTIDGLYAEGTT